MTADFQFGSDDQRREDSPVAPPAGDGLPSMPSQPVIPPVPPVTPYQGTTYTPPTPVNPPMNQPPVNGAGGYPPAYGSQPGYTYNAARGGQPYTYYQQQQPGYIAPYYPPPAAQSAGNGFAITSLILGIVSLLTSCSLFLAAPCAVIGLIMGIVGRTKGAGGMAVAGIVLSVVGLVFSIFLVILVVYSDSFNYWYTLSSLVR